MKKIIVAIFVLSFVAMPAVSNAGFFDWFRIDFANQSAQVKSSVSTTASTSYKQGDRNDTIKSVQVALRGAGVYTGSVNGVFGSKTKAAVMEWQKMYSMPMTGILDTTTIDSILGRDGFGEGRDEEISNTTPAPTLSYLQGRCNTNNGVTSGRWSRVRTPWTGDEILHPNDLQIQVAVCDIIQPKSPRTLVVFASNDGQLQTQLYRSDATPEAQQMEVVIDDSYAPLKIYNITMHTSQLPFPIGFHTMKSSLYNPNNNDLLEQSWTAPGQFEIVEEVSGGSCDSDNVGLQILPLSIGMTQMDDFPVLEFRVSNETNCDVALEDMTFIYMVTDTLPYFEELSVMERDTNMVVAEGTIEGASSGESLWVTFNETDGYMIEAGDQQEFVMYLQTYNQPVQGTLSSNDYTNKNLIFGFSKEDQVDFKFWSNGVEVPQSHSWDLGTNRWGEIVKLPAEAF